MWINNVNSRVPCQVFREFSKSRLLSRFASTKTGWEIGYKLRGRNFYTYCQANRKERCWYRASGDSSKIHTQICPQNTTSLSNMEFLLDINLGHSVWLPAQHTAMDVPLNPGNSIWAETWTFYKLLWSPANGFQEWTLNDQQSTITKSKRESET